MAHQFFIVTSMLIAGLATTSLAAPSTLLTVETCGISKPCSPNDTYTILCPASVTCNEYYKCDKGVVSIHTCEKAFYLFWLAPVYDPARNCCKLVCSLCSLVRPDEKGLCAAVSEVPAVPADYNDTTVHVKRHALAEPAVPPVQTDAEHRKEPSKEEAKPLDSNPENATKKPEDGQKESEVNKPESKDRGAKPFASSATVVTTPSSAIVVAVLLSMFRRQ